MLLAALGRGDPSPPPDLTPFTLEERSLALRLHKASEYAARQLVTLLMGEHQLMQRLASVKHYFLLDQVCMRLTGALELGT